jgi:hypothetical protein
MGGALAFGGIGLFSLAAVADDEPIAKTTEAAAIDGAEIFSREWIPGDSRSHGGDGLGPVFNDSSCVACHNQGGVGGGGPASKNVDIVTAFHAPVPNTPHPGIQRVPMTLPGLMFQSVFGNLDRVPAQKVAPAIEKDANGEKEQGTEQEEAGPKKKTATELAAERVSRRAVPPRAVPQRAAPPQLKKRAAPRKEAEAARSEATTVRKLKPRAPRQSP